MSAAFDSRGLWAMIADPASCAVEDCARAAPAATRLADLVSPALASHVLAAAASRCAAPLIDPAHVEKSRLYNRFQRRAQLGGARLLADAGVPFVIIKGFANAHVLYDEPAARVVGDLDVLVRPGDLRAAIDVFAGARYSFRSGDLPPWGFQATSSFAPLVSADGQCNVDLHTAPDSDPLDRALSADAVFTASRVVETNGLSFRAPSPEHMFVLCVSNAAKDKFGPFMAKKILDATQLLRRAPHLDWAAVDAIFAAAELRRAAATFLNLLGALGLHGYGSARKLPAMAAGEFRRLVAEWRDVRPSDPSVLTKLRREWLLAEPGVALRAARRRVQGLVRRRSGVLPHAPTLAHHPGPMDTRP